MTRCPQPQHRASAPEAPAKPRRRFVASAFGSLVVGAAAAAGGIAARDAHAAGSGAGPSSHAHGAGSAPYSSLAPFACTDASLACATSATPAWAPDGRLWVAWVAAGTVSVAYSQDAGVSFSTPIVVDRPGAYADLGPDARPRICVLPDGRIVVAYASFVDDDWNARVRVSVSDDGRSFSAPVPIEASRSSQRFPAMAATAEGALFVAWIDKRRVDEAARRGRRRAGASIAFAWSHDGGQSFSPSRLAAEHSCECCRIALALDAGQRPLLLYRGLFDGHVRDHALVAFDDAGGPGAPTRVSDDDWAIDACPHHGPALAVAGDGSLHAAWFTQGRRRSGAFHARSPDHGRSFPAPMPLATDRQRATRPSLLADGANVYLAWKSFDGELTRVQLRRSRDHGRSWSPPREVARTDAYSDHPQLVACDGDACLSWQTQAEGYRLLPLENDR